MEYLLDGNDWQLIPLMPSEWVWRKVWEETWQPRSSPATGDWLRGTVPGDVISDAIDAGLAPNPCVDLNSRACEWLSERDWVYRRQFNTPDATPGKVIRLHFGGVDFACRVYLNGELLGAHEGMMVPFEFDVTALLRRDAPNTLTVVVLHAPPVDAVQGQIGWTSKARLWKSRFTYNWDWCTRLIPLGIWQSVKLVVTDNVWLKDVWARPIMSDQGARISVSAQVTFNRATAQASVVRLIVEDPSGQIIAQRDTAVTLDRLPANAAFIVDVAEPQLWWPNGMGAQPVYRVRVDALNDAGEVSDSRSVPCGLRTIRAATNDGAPPDALPYTLEVNGRKMFVKGWNWAPIDNLYGRPHTERYERWVRMAAHAHCNLLRVWGGGLLEREHFYDLCDRLGILVWQEFMHSSSGVQNAPPEDEAYLDSIEQQARQMIPLKRNHPSLAIWCGGNELMDDAWRPLTDQHKALARLKRIVRELDPDRLWLPTSSSGPHFSADPQMKGTGAMHDVHGPWQYQGPEAQYHLYNNIDALYHSEFGAEGAANLWTLRQYISSQYHWPPDASNPMWVHHGSWWLHRERLEALFGPLNNIETFIQASQWMQAEGLRYAIEANRRRKWQCSGVSPWQFNEAFPNTACTNALDFAGLTKPVYWWVRNAYEAAHLSLKYDRLAWKPGETWQAEVWANNSLTARDGWRWRAQVISLTGDLLVEAGGQIDLADNAALAVDQLAWPVAAGVDAWLVMLSLHDEQDRIASRNTYAFSASVAAPMKPLLAAPETKLGVRKREGALEIVNAGSAPALFIQIEPLAGQWLTLGDNYFTLLPGETHTVTAQGAGQVSVKGWNTSARKLKL